MPKPSIVISIFDRDKHIVPNDKEKNYKSLGSKVYRFNIPALINNERNKDDKICIEHYYSNDEIEVLTDFGHLYMGKDFNQYGLSHDNKYCFHNFSKNTNITPITIIDNSNDHLQKLTDNACCITKDGFADYVISHPDEFNFENFKKIFNVISEIASNEVALSNAP